ncbi:aldolase [Metabacillus sp. GX 13764]|uniref:HPr kinase/phosphorylase n=1 Tax=Metabacillus kandeliae TaxID=2900151 RepID=UPI001E480A64|nr:aldolase [Metabacillus kandeliae]MCD7033161.1 aldolase [Metabacillus kandeliae]
MQTTLKRYAYTVFGLSLESEIPLPELIHFNRPALDLDCEIVIRDLTSVWDSLSSGESKFFMEKDHVMFKAANTAIFSIKDGSRIIVSPFPGADFAKIRLYILGSCMGALLMQKGMLPLHGSAIEIDGRAYAIVGESGAGKSTTAAAFLKEGFKLLSDDVISIENREGVPLVFPAYPQQKLWQESMNSFEMQTQHYQPLFERETKYAIPVQDQFCNQPLPLAGVFELVKKDSGKVSISSVRGLEKLDSLFRNTYRNFFIEGMGLVSWHFKATSSFGKSIDYYKLSRPEGTFTAKEVINIILNTIKKAGEK